MRVCAIVEKNADVGKRVYGLWLTLRLIIRFNY